VEGGEGSVKEDRQLSGDMQQALEEEEEEEDARSAKLLSLVFAGHQLAW